MLKIKRILLLAPIMITFLSFDTFSQDGTAFPVKVKDLMVIKSLNDHNDIYDYVQEYLAKNNFAHNQVVSPIPHLSFIYPGCDPKRLEDKILNSSQKNIDIFTYFNEYFDRCGDQLARNSFTGLPGLIRFASTEYSFFEHPKIKQVVVQLSDNTFIPGVLALKDTTTPRPFIVLKCGVFCDAGEGASMRNYMMNFFDQSPFNVLFLANKTGIDYIKLNRKFTLGGDAEGPETMAIGRWVKEQSSFKDIISSLHMVGVSLGGNAAIFTSYYSNKIRDMKGEAIFKSVSAICPVLDLHDSMEHLYQDGIMSHIAEYATKQQLQDGKDYFDDVNDLLVKMPGRSEMKDYLGGLASESLTRRGHPITPDKFWDSNSYFKRMPASVDIPTFVFASKDDHIVNNAANTGRLKQSFNAFTKGQLGIVNLPYGDHCGFNSVYGVNVTSTILRSFILHNSQEYTAKQYKKIQIPWHFAKVKIKSYEVNLSQKFEFTKESNHVDIHFKVLNKWANFGTCFFTSTYFPNSTCVFSKKISIPVEDLQFLGARIPQNTAEAEALSREFDAKVKFLVDNVAMTGKSKTMDSISYRNW